GLFGLGRKGQAVFRTLGRGLRRRQRVDELRAEGRRVDLGVFQHAGNRARAGAGGVDEGNQDVMPANGRALQLCRQPLGVSEHATGSLGESFEHIYLLRTWTVFKHCYAVPMTVPENAKRYVTLREAAEETGASLPALRRWY